MKDKKCVQELHSLITLFLSMFMCKKWWCAQAVKETGRTVICVKMMLRSSLAYSSFLSKKILFWLDIASVHSFNFNYLIWIHQPISFSTSVFCLLIHWVKTNPKNLMYLKQNHISRALHCRFSSKKQLWEAVIVDRWASDQLSGREITSIPTCLNSLTCTDIFHGTPVRDAAFFPRFVPFRLATMNQESCVDKSLLMRWVSNVDEESINARKPYCVDQAVFLSDFQ